MLLQSHAALLSGLDPDLASCLQEMARLTDLESGNESPSGRSDSDFTGPDPDEIAQVSQRCCTGVISQTTIGSGCTGERLMLQQLHASSGKCT